MSKRYNSYITKSNSGLKEMYNNGKVRFKIMFLNFYCLSYTIWILEKKKHQSVCVVYACERNVDDSWVFWTWGGVFTRGKDLSKAIMTVAKKTSKADLAIVGGYIYQSPICVATFLEGGDDFIEKQACLYEEHISG